MDIRPAVLEDLPRLADIERETAAMFPASLLPPHLALPLPAARLARGVAQSSLWVATAGDAGPVGFVLCERIDGHLHIAEIDVCPAYGRRGLGARLLARACAAGSRRGLAFATLTTFEHVPWNAPYYARLGFARLRDASGFPHLEAALREERERGLRDRVAMARVIAPGPAGWAAT